MDPATKEMDKKPLKQLMVNQLQIAFEREMLILSPFDETLYKQLIDYEVVRYSAIDHTPVFTSENEHFVDALGLAYLAFVLEFPGLTAVIDETKTATIMEQISQEELHKPVERLYRQINAQEALHNQYTDPFMDEPDSKILIPKPIYESHVMTSRGTWGSRYSRTRCQRGRW